MKQEIKAARLAALLGLEAPKEPTLEEKREAAITSREAEAVLLYAENPKGFIQRDCKTCGHTFAVNRTCISYCSDKCRGIALESIGIIWDPTRSPADRWNSQTGGPEPLVVPPAALPLAQAAAEAAVLVG